MSEEKEEEEIKTEEEQNHEETKEQTYVVQSGDTLQSLALKFDCPISWIKVNNHIFSDLILPGDILKIPAVPQNEYDFPIDASLYFDDPQEGNPTKGKLLLIDGYLRFEPNDHTLRPIVINLVGHIESAIFPCPSVVIMDDPEMVMKPETPYLLLITFLHVIDDPSSVDSICFCSTHEKLQKFHPKLLSLATAAQEAQKFVPPDINTTPKKTKEEVEFPKLERSKISSAPVQRPRRIPGTTPITFYGGVSNVLTEDEICKIRCVLPSRFRSLNWKLLFQLSRDGSSYTSFYSSTHGYQPLVMIISNQYGDKIGAYISKGLKMSKQYYGSGETFVFRYNPDFEYFPWKETHSNQYFVSSSSKNVGIGGGGTSAIWIDGNLLNAFSEACSTFNSPSLTKQVKFKVRELEVWTICQKRQQER
ncbi:TLD family protein [Histomonas meleagridis]|uniref:TLD family protein n=1 Tax=Histomonas meleagridis TaxID=135588 RepID=UPI00355A5040|nr:TLD family protein [Histomonas meleagridis]KAH0803630.1 TLD family protein [Histomonas meleagridis]